MTSQTQVYIRENVESSSDVTTNQCSQRNNEESIRKLHELTTTVFARYNSDPKDVELFSVAIETDIESLSSCMAFMYNNVSFYRVTIAGCGWQRQTRICDIDIDIEMLIEFAKRMDIYAAVQDILDAHGSKFGHAACILRPSHYEPENEKVYFEDMPSNIGSLRSFINGHTIVASDGENGRLLALFARPRTLQIYKALKKHGYRLPTPAFFENDDKVWSSAAQSKVYRNHLAQILNEQVSSPFLDGPLY